MKSTALFILLLTTNVLLAQSKATIPDFDDTSFNWKDGYGEVVKVKFLNGLDGDKVMDKKIFQKIVIKSLVDAKLKLNNKLSFVPKELIIMNNDEEHTIQVKYLGKNAYGTESELKSVFVFDAAGELTSSF